jgi:hypothetical protein
VSSGLFRGPSISTVLGLIAVVLTLSSKTKPHASFHILLPKGSCSLLLCLRLEDGWWRQSSPAPGTVPETEITDKGLLVEVIQFFPAQDGNKADLVLGF